VYESVKPTSGLDKLLWYTLGAKTLELIHDNISVMDAEFLVKLLQEQNPKKMKELQI
jgi:type I restriction enzyme, R subunit